MASQVGTWSKVKTKKEKGQNGCERTHIGYLVTLHLQETKTITLLDHVCKERKRAERKNTIKPCRLVIIT